MEFVLANAGDGLGSVAALSKLNGSTVEVVERYEYDAFGKTTVCDSSGTPRTPNASAYGNPTMFTGRRYDAETGLYYYRARMYSPALGRFLQTDPIGYGDGMNLYAYCHNNPVNWIDPWGLRHYNYEQTMQIIDNDIRSRSYPGINVPWTPLRHLIDRDLSYGWGYDFKFTGDTFTVLDENGEEETLTGPAFGNYIAGYLGYYWWGGFGEWGMYRGGELFAYWETGSSDDSDSVEDIATGVKDACERKHQENQKSQERLKSVPGWLRLFLSLGPI